MNATIRCGAGVALLMLVTACQGSGPASPAVIDRPVVLSPAPPPAPAQPPVAFPPLAGPSRSFVFDRELSYKVREFTRQSRVILYDNGAFGLQYPSYTYTGAYEETDGVVMFLFDSAKGRSVGEPWDDVIGTLNGRSLTLQYDELMQHSDFENAVYVLMPQ